MDKIIEISNILKEEGFFSFLLKLKRYIKYNFYGISGKIIFELDLKKSTPKVNTKLDINFKLATESDVNKMDEENYNFDENGKRYIKGRIKKGDKCVLALYKNKIIGYLCVMYNEMEITQQKHISLQKDKVYTFKGFVLKEYRGNRVQSAMYAYIVDMLKKEGKHYVISTVYTDNKPSLKTKAKNRAEYKRIGIIVHVRFFGLKYDYMIENN